ncbi:MAG: DNA alkylation repair protein [Candidatus Staskawiczbacteria bacterium]|nr:DNA alkylation repair protein [Candidatus Staskawiczbacteria bacterium]
MEYEEIIKKLESLKNPRNVEGMAHFGIRPKITALGAPTPELRKLARQIKKDHDIALKLWDKKIHESRVLASMVDEPDKVTEKQMEKWAEDFDSWGVCDQACMNLFCRTKFAHKKVFDFAKREEEFVRRTAFALIATLAVHDKKATDKEFIKFFPLIKKASTDERNFVKKAVNWALRQIGKRNKKLNKEAIKLAKEIHPVIRPGAPLDNGAKSAKWIASDALRELTSEAVQKRLNEKYLQ